MKKNGEALSKTASVLSIAAVVIMLMFFAHLYFAENIAVKDNRETEKYSRIAYFEKTDVEDPFAPVGIYSEYRFKIREDAGRDFSLAFYLVHQYVEVYIDGKEVYSLLPAENSPIETVGSNWVTVPLLNEDAGKEILVKVIPVYEEFIEREPEFFVGSLMKIFMTEIAEDFNVAVLCVLVIFVGFAYLFTGVFLRIKKIGGKTISLLGILSVFLGGARLADTKTIQFLLPEDSLLLFFISIIPMMIGTLPMLTASRKRLNGLGRIICNVAAIIISAVSITMMIFQFLGLSEIRQNLFVVHILLVFGALCIMATIPMSSVENKKLRMAPLMIVAAGVIADIIIFYEKGTSTGLVASLTAFLIYDVFMGVKTVTDFIENEKKIKRQEEELQESRVSMMLSQIQPHFLYNSISAISELCRRNPEEARSALGDFAGYLRGNMDSLRERKPIPFYKEKEHIETYLRLEKMRFGDELNVVWNVEESDFSIPSLTVQPLVENAVKHGICIGEGGGTVTVSTEKRDGKIVITVKDDGAGFDPSKPISGEKERSHVGIENVKNRLETMVGGKLFVESEPGKGTVATILLDEERTE